ncbi:MAG: sugar phosphate isomerase/epimerase [Pseudomonadota bacterium]
MGLSFQLYSARSYPDLAELLSLLAELGYDQVEGFGGLYEDPKATRAALDQAGLRMTSGHVLLPEFESDLNRVADLAETLGIGQLYAPYLDEAERPADRAGWARFAERLAMIGQRVHDRGLRFGWHNHDFEFAPLADGSVPMQVILDEAPDLEWQADLAWIHRAGADPLAWIEAHALRITGAHVKDIAATGEAVDEDGWADLGQGVMDWATLLGALRAAQVELLVLEHDNPSDPERFARRSIAGFEALAEGAA